MNISRLTLILGVFIFLSLNMQALAIGDNPQTRTSLQGIKKIYVEIDKQGVDNRVTPSLLMEDISAKLRLSNVRINDEKVSADAVMRIYINGIRAGEDTYLYYISVEVNQMVQTIDSSQRPSVRVYAATWGTSSIGKASNEDMPQMIRNDLKELVEIFLSAHALSHQGS